MASKKIIAGKILKCSPRRVTLNVNRMDEINEAITRKDIKFLINTGAIIKNQAIGISKVRARHTASQKRKGRQRGHGSRKGGQNSRGNRKRAWINAVRVQRSYLQHLREEQKIDFPVYKEMYGKIKGGFFRSKRHISLYLTERGLMKK